MSGTDSARATRCPVLTHGVSVHEAATGIHPSALLADQREERRKEEEAEKQREEEEGGKGEDARRRGRGGSIESVWKPAYEVRSVTTIRLRVSSLLSAP
eukprot:3941350-Rhodomonas_salina.1